MAEVDVFAPVKGFNGVSVGVVFSDGHAVVDDKSMAFKYFRRKGYRISATAEEDEQEEQATEEVKTSVADEVEIPGLPGKDATRGQVAEFAEGMGLETEGLTKAQILAAIKAESNK